MAQVLKHQPERMAQIRCIDFDEGIAAFDQKGNLLIGRELLDRSCERNVSRTSHTPRI